MNRCKLVTTGVSAAALAVPTSSAFAAAQTESRRHARVTGCRRRPASGAMSSDAHGEEDHDDRRNRRRRSRGRSSRLA